MYYSQEYVTSWRRSTWCLSKEESSSSAWTVSRHCYTMSKYSSSPTLESPYDVSLRRMGRFECFPANHHLPPELVERLKQCRPVAIFQCGTGELLLCYNGERRPLSTPCNQNLPATTPECGLYVDRKGRLSRQGVLIEWERTAEQAAWHPPYLILFSARFIEIRHGDTGNLVQIMPANGIRHIGDGRRSVRYPRHNPRTHVVQESSSGGLQKVFQFLPVTPLYGPRDFSPSAPLRSDAEDGPPPPVDVQSAETDSESE